MPQSRCGNIERKMKQIATYLQEYFHETWNATLFAVTGTFLALSFAINYGFDFETHAIERLQDPLLQILFYFLFYGIPFAFTIFVVCAGTDKRMVFRNKQFILLTLFCITLLAVYVTLHNVPAMLSRSDAGLVHLIPPQWQWYATRYASNLAPGLAIILPLFLHWRLVDRENSRFYGFSASHVSLKTYFGILILLAPIVLVASFSSDFQSTYPRYKFGLPLSALGLERFLAIGLFEVCYGVDFVFVELLFRGFMVMAFARFLGSGAILPMVVVYAFIHFQKPLGEALGSIVGGFPLGVIALRTKSIYGGVILHLGIAYMMEIAGAIQLSIR